MNKLQILQDLEKEVQVCTKCDLHSTRTKTVFNRGNPQEEITFFSNYLKKH